MKKLSLSGDNQGGIDVVNVTERSGGMEERRIMAAYCNTHIEAAKLARRFSGERAFLSLSTTSLKQFGITV